MISAVDVDADDDDDDVDGGGSSGDASAAFRPMYLYAWPGYTLYIAMINDKFMMCYDSQRCQEPAHIQQNIHTSVFYSFNLSMSLYAIYFHVNVM